MHHTTAFSPTFAVLRLLGSVAVIVAAGGCGLEACTVGDFKPTPEGQAVIEGRLDDLPEGLRARLEAKPLRAQAISVDGAVLAETSASVGEQFTLALGEGLDHFNVRVVVDGGSLVIKDFVAEAAVDSVVTLDSLGVSSTTSAQIVERYAVRERQSLASTPASTLTTVRANALGNDDAVVAFRAIIARVLGGLDPSSGTAGFDVTSFSAGDAALAAAGIERAAYDAALEAAVDASLVPIVCDPSQVNVLFTVDVSGQGKDGNGAPQVLRQPVKEGKIFLGITLDSTSPVPDSAGTLRPRLTPNDPRTELFDSGDNGDEVAGDGIFSRVIGLPRGMRVLYKYTNGSPNEGFTATEEWPGNARILQVDDVITSSASGQPDCLVIRRDSFGDEASNKNFVNLNARLGGGDLGYDDDLGGAVFTPGEIIDGEVLLPNVGLAVDGTRTQAPLSPATIPESRENGICTVCPPPLTVSADDDDAPRLLAASFLAVDQTRVVFSEDVDVQSAGVAGNYLLVDADNAAVRVTQALVVGSQVTLTHVRVDPRKGHRVSVKNIKDASLQQNEIAEGSSLAVGPDRTPPVVVAVRGGSIVELNAASRPRDPSTGEVFVITFSEELDRIAAENAANYVIDDLTVHAAFQRGREVLLVTSQHERGRTYALQSKDAFDVAGNVIVAGRIDAQALSLSLVTFQAVVDYAFTSIDGQTRGLPAGDDLFLTGTVLRDARSVDGADLRVAGRTDVAGLTGFKLTATDTLVDGGRIHALTLRLPAGAAAYKFAHGNARAALDPPVSLESVSKGLATRNDGGGVAVDPHTLLGKDGVSYASARLSTNGADLPGPGVLFKRENPDALVVVGEADKALAPEVIGTWRDVPFGRGVDYDDGLTDLPLVVAGAVDTTPPRLLAARARDSESVLLSFDEAVVASGAVTVGISNDAGALPVVERFVGQPLSTQVVVRTGAMVNDSAYALVISGIADARGNGLAGPVTAGFTSPAGFQAFQPLVDDIAPAVSSVRATSPSELEVLFTERLADASVGAADFEIGGSNAPDVVSVRVLAGGLRVLITTTPQTRQSAYTLSVADVADIAGNVIDDVTVNFSGFGEFDAPEIGEVIPLSSTAIALVFNERVTAASATRLTSYLVSEVQTTAVRFGGSDELRNAAFNATFAPLSQDIVILTTSPMTGGGTYTVNVEGVQDLSGNESNAVATFTAVATAPTVDVLLTYTISNTLGVVGVGPGGTASPPSRAISPQTLSAQREGVFVVGGALSTSGAATIATHPFTAALGGFPVEGAPLDGVETELKDDGQNGDRTAGDNIYTLRIRAVPVGSTVSWKAFASFTAAFGAANPTVPGAAFADAPRGPSVFGDGQEFPGNDNAVFIVGDDNDDGVLTIDCLFGDEITYKRKTGFPAFHFALGTARRAE